MKKSDDAIPCRLTGPDGEVLWSGTIGSLRRDARKLRELGRRNKKVRLERDRSATDPPDAPEEAPDAE